MSLAPLPAQSNFTATGSHAKSVPVEKTKSHQAPAGGALTEVPDDAPIHFWADRLIYREKQKLITANGHVEIRRGGDVLRADRIIYDQKAGRIEVRGNVVFNRVTGDVIKAERFELTDDLKDGVAHQIMLITSDNARAWADKIVRQDGRDMILSRGAYTPCEVCEDDPDKAPLWMLKAEEVRMDEVERRVYFEDTSLEVLGVPVAYMPYLSFPDPRVNKASGFLVPTFGHHGDLGFYFGVPYFFNLAPHRDLTIDPVIYFQTGQAMLRFQYREATENGAFFLGGSGTYITTDNSVGGVSRHGEELRGHLEGGGRFDIDENWRWGFDLLRASDDTYLRRYDLNDSKTLTSHLYTEGFFGRNYALLEGFSFQNQRLDRDDSLTPDLVTSMAYDHVSAPNDFGAYWTANGGLLGVMRSDNWDSTRLHGDLEWHLPHITDTGHVFDLRAGVTLAAYQTADYVNPLTGQTVEDSKFQSFPYTSLAWRYPLARDHGDHTELLEPMVQVLASPNPSEDPSFPNEDSQGIWFSDNNLFDANRYPGLDRFDGGQRLDYGLRWALRDRKEGGDLEFFLGQSHRLHEATQLDRATGLEDGSSDIVGHARVSPNDYVDLSYRFRLANENLDLRQSILRLSTGIPTLRLTLDHTYVNQMANSIGPDERNELYTKIDTQLNAFWSASIFERHQFSTPNGNMAAGASLTYQDECLRVDLEVERNRYRDRDVTPETTFMMRISLKNLGNFAEANGLN